MNLHDLVRDATTTINDDISATLQRSTGYTTAADGSRVSTYATFTGMIQVQGITEGDYVHVNNLQQQGVLRAVWLLGHWAGVVRAGGQGGDLMQFPMYQGGPVQTWRVLVVKEAWPDWCSVIVVLQS